MCGIAGIVKNTGNTVGPFELRRMLKTLAHRGPDGTGLHIEANVGLAHTRLSIVDIDCGHQPMSSDDGLLWITFNGEIFNYIELREGLEEKGHQFRTRSDTEVILHLYQEFGENCVDQLNGQWVFAIWDDSNRKLFLSRDRMGVRPLFYTQTNSSFIFASELKAILANSDVPREVDLKGLDQIFTFWVTIAPRTALRNIWQLPPGHSMTVREGKIGISQYWKPEYVSTADLQPDSAAEKVEELLALLSDAARIRLRADVPVGAYLSGGIDSTFITALVKRFAQDRLCTFSVAFEAPEFDESSFQNEASRYLETDHAQIRCSGSDIARVFPDVIRHTEQPIVRTAPAPLFLLSRLVRDSGFKVVLTGEGSDEILGGYDIFKEDKIRRFWAKQPQSRLRPILLRRLYPYLENIQRQPEAYLRNFFRVRPDDIENPFFSHLTRWELTSRIKLFFSDSVKAELGHSEALAELTEQLPTCYSRWPSFCRSQYLETAYLLPGYILSSQGDRMAMAHSVEGRYPFLDHRVVDFAARLHPSTKMKVLNEKFVLKRAAKGLVPDSILRRTKQPYRAPDGQSFFPEKKLDYVDDLLCSERIKGFGLFDAGSVGKLVAKFQSRRPVSTMDDMAMVGILSTQMWIQQFVQSLSDPRHQ